jgi:hypothetical protein
MRSSGLVFLLLAFCLSTSFGQQLSPSDKELLKTARKKYYNLSVAGFDGMNCLIKYDYATVPLMPSSEEDPLRKLLETTAFTLAIDSKGRVTVDHQFPADSSEEARQHAAQLTNLMTAFASGLFQTWATKGLQGPIPPFDSEIASVSASGGGYVFSLRVPGSPVEVKTDKDFLVSEITSVGGRLIEHPVYGPSSDGFVFVGNAAVDQSNPTQTVEISYQLELSLINGLRVPTSAHLQVKPDIHTTFRLDGCAVRKGTVIHIAP